MSGITKAPILWSFRRCPFAIRARLAIAASGQIVQLREILLQKKPTTFLAMSPKGKVPMLDLRDGRIIDESRDIMFWALDKNDPEGWLDTWRRQPDRVELFLNKLDGSFKNNLDRYKYASRYDASLARFHRNDGKKFLITLNEMLKQTGALSGSNLGIMDYACLPFVRQFRIADPDWFDAQSWLHLKFWLNSFLHSTRFNKVMQKYLPWYEGAKEICFPEVP
ncbi:glutathione S-transferase N-terminal domain-containing protein [Candidatus Puniceispirillum sp.]|nr:glutathione S-transferase N-terminal domain-containing protein [Candidatus Puniceispirillum sp.]